jgi:galactose mutarotase-like enzyme
MITLENETASATIRSFGAELTSLFNKYTGLEYIWQAGKEWPKSSPVLFPVVGSLKNGSYIYDGNSYPLDRHGFARTREFKVEYVDETTAVFVLVSDDETLKIYPFPFELKIIYTLIGGELKVVYEVTNTGNSDIYFSLGAHPAFKVPLNDAYAYKDYYLEFSKTETIERWMLNDGLLGVSSVPFLNNENILPLKKELFADDAIVLKNLFSNRISIKNNKDEHGMHFNFSGYPYFGIWAAKGADFVCLEPWMGITDNMGSSGKLEEKEGILKLAHGDNFTCSWFVISF